MLKTNVKRIDPSRTALLRRAFLAEMNRRFAKLYQEIKKLIVEEDAFGLKKRTPLVILVAPNRFAFTSNPQKLQAFHTWLQDQINQVVFIVSGHGMPGQPWTYQYIEPAIRKGVGRAYSDVSKESLAASPAWYKGSREQFLKTAFGQPTTMHKVELLSLRAFTQLQGVTALMSQQMSRILSTGLIMGQNPLVIAREMQKSIAGLSRVRARMIARTEIIHAHAEGQLEGFRLLGIEELGILAEWSTAGDDLVCADCGAMEGEVFTIDEAEGLLPIHPNSFAKDTEIYTKKGFVNVSELTKKDKCLSLNTETFDLEYVPVIATISHYQKQMLHFKSHNFDLLVTPEHEMFAKRRERPWTNKRSWEFIQAKNIINETAFYRSSEWMGSLASAVMINRQNISARLFCEFMGWWLSEGSFNGKRIDISQSRKVHPEKYQRILEVANALSTKGSKVWTGKEHIYFYNMPLRKYLSRFGKSYEKYIPDKIKELSPEYLRIFLDAYAAGDGSVRKGRVRMGGKFRDEIVYTTSSKRMADGLGELLIKVGRRPSYSLMKTKGKTLQFRNGPYTMNHDMWVIRECYAQTSCVVPRTGITIKKHKYNNYVYCVELAKWHTLLARRNGKVTWVGNCRCCWIPSEVPV